MDDLELHQRLKGVEEALALLRFPLPPQLLRLSDTAKILRCSRKTVRDYINSGELPASVLRLKNTTVYRVKQSDLNAWIDGKAFKKKTTSMEAKSIRVPRGPF